MSMSMLGLRKPCDKFAEIWRVGEWVDRNGAIDMKNAAAVNRERASRGDR